MCEQLSDAPTKELTGSVATASEQLLERRFAELADSEA